MRLIGLKNTFRTLLAGLVVLAGASAAQASSVVGSQAIAELGPTTINTVSITTATVFNFGALVTTANFSGDFSTFGAGGQLLGSSTLTVATPATFTFGNAAFGTFTGGTISSDSGINTREFTFIGTFAGGTLFPLGLRDAGPASLIVSLNQAGGPGTAISTSISLALPPVPEPASVVMLGLGLVGVVGAARLRRKAA